MQFQNSKFFIAICQGNLDINQCYWVVGSEFLITDSSGIRRRGLPVIDSQLPRQLVQGTEGDLPLAKDCWALVDWVQGACHS